MAFSIANAVSVPSFSGLRSIPDTNKTGITASHNGSMMPKKRANLAMVGARASSLLEEASMAGKCFLSAAVLAASVMVATPAMAVDVVMGADDGTLKFIPQEITVAAGEKINFINNAGYPHNVVFDEDEVPEGVDATALSMTDEDYLNSKGEVYSVTLSKPGTYKFYCAPHQGAGMVGTAIVN